MGACLEAKQVELENGGRPAASPLEKRGRKAALFFFLPWAACVGCAGGAATEAEGFLDQLTRLGKGGGASWGFDSLGILNCETLEAASAQAPEIGLRLL